MVAVTLHNLGHGILANVEFPPNFPVGPTCLDALQHLGGQSVGFDALPGPSPQQGASGFGRGET